MQLEFLFFIVVVIAFLVVVPNHRLQKIFLLLSSYYFYGYWNYRFLLLLAFTTVVHYLAGIGISSVPSLKVKKAILIISWVISLGVLGIFKYYNFFIQSLNTALAPLHWNLGMLNIILPIGISFFTFQSISYTVDVYREKLPACRDFLDFALFIAFFPLLLSGPITRATDFLPQLKTKRQLNWARIYSGGRQFMFGLFKKAFIADHLAFFVDTCFVNHSVYDSATMWLAVVGYTLQIFCDFSGYSDMAIGVARILGYDLRINFDLPYISQSVTEFWRRWHISLSTWLRDYLYIPLGGNRHGKVRTYLNLLMTMVLGGLWHGAAWTFVFWGAWHGAALGIHKFYKEKWECHFKIPVLAGMGLTLLVVVVGWVFFRADSFSHGGDILACMFMLRGGVRWLDPFALSCVLLAVFYHILYYLKKNQFLQLERVSVYSISVLTIMLYLVILFKPEGFHPFIYFKY